MSTALVTTTRSGIGYWLASLRAMMRFDMGRARQWAVLMMVIQVMMSTGMAFMYASSSWRPVVLFPQWSLRQSQ